MKKDHYKTLGVSRQASDKDIKTAYRKKARKTHPDMNPGDTEAEARFKDVSEAYQTLSDPGKKAEYDREKDRKIESEIVHREHDGFHRRDIFGFSGLFNDIFGMFFGHSRWEAEWKRDRPGTVNIRSGFEEIFEEPLFHEGKKDRPEAFVDLSDIGVSGGRVYTHGTCGFCGGAGEIRIERSGFFEHFIHVQTCPYCKGRGGY